MFKLKKKRKTNHKIKNCKPDFEYLKISSAYFQNSVESNEYAKNKLEILRKQAKYNKH